ncbi:unnamed protein product, partial [Calypogeia fissa]
MYAFLALNAGTMPICREEGDAA